MLAEIITIGDEILIGQITDTNSAWLGQELSRLGIRVIHRASVSDNKSQILRALHDAAERAQLVIITGGLGPTKDDVTKHTLAEFFGCDLVLNERVLQWVTDIFTMRKLPMLESNRQQAMVPANCDVLFNRSGTAPGMWFNQSETVFVSLPGVPFEMKTIFTEEVIPKIKEQFKLPAIFHHTIQTVGIGESFLARKIEAWENSLPPHIQLAYLPAVGAVRLRLSAYGDNEANLRNEVLNYTARLKDVAGEYIYAEGEISLPQAIGQLLREKQLSLSTAESCTGGYLAHLITSVPGSSAYYQGSVLAYANSVKVNELGVNEHILEEHGAVSEAVVIQMAESVRKKLATDYALATSGIAGPDGGTAQKPVGTVWIAVAGPEGSTARMFNMGDNRERTIQRTALSALDMLRRSINNLPQEEARGDNAQKS
jgi:nicotinamide-nucleotide amidase